jgi:hypothetical protein
VERFLSVYVNGGLGLHKVSFGALGHLPFYRALDTGTGLAAT